jgi:hypothetical protein
VLKPAAAWKAVAGVKPVDKEDHSEVGAAVVAGRVAALALVVPTPPVMPLLDPFSLAWSVVSSALLWPLLSSSLLWPLLSEGGDGSGGRDSIYIQRH